MHAIHCTGKALLPRVELAVVAAAAPVAALGGLGGGLVSCCSVGTRALTAWLTDFPSLVSALLATPTASPVPVARSAC